MDHSTRLVQLHCGRAVRETDVTFRRWSRYLHQPQPGTKKENAKQIKKRIRIA
jgi:hypothetical protein